MYKWTTAQVKKNAKAAFRSFGYWKAFFATLIFLIIPLCSSEGDLSTFLFSLLDLSATVGAIFSQILSQIVGSSGADVLVQSLIASLGSFGIIVAFLAVFALNAFVVGPLIVGRNRYFMEHRGCNADIGKLFWAFTCGHYFNIVKIVFIMNLKVALWSLLLIIPGVIKKCEYFAVPYILAENPTIDMKEAFKLSKEMTDGQKFDIWWLDISFLGWWLLSAFTFGIGEYFLYPYIYATKAEVYSVLRDIAHENGIADFTVLPGFFSTAI